MYNYEWDRETGGYILTTKIIGVTKEIRPVFKEELRLLEFDRKLGWIIPDTEAPIMWCEGRKYIYHGELVAEVVGGSLYSDCQLRSYTENLTFTPVNVEGMLQKNRSLLEGLIQQTQKFIYRTYRDYLAKNTDMIYVAFSGGKDSIVLLDLVQKSLPHDRFKVFFADTTMEMASTYEAVNTAKNLWPDLSWHIARADFDSYESWRKIGPPAEKLRWCCSVHKTAPQVLAIKALLKKNRFKTLVFVGVRAEESEARSTYDIISESKKHIMQTSCCPILNWNTSELFLYMLQNNLFLNGAYKNGLTRAGCIFCPMSSKWSFMLNRKIEPERVNQYVDIICDSSNIEFDTAEDRIHYFNERNWKLRLNGRDLKLGAARVKEEIVGEHTYFKLQSIKDDWKIWISTIGHFYQVDDAYILEYLDIRLDIYVEQKEDNSLELHFSTLPNTKTAIRLMHLIRNALYKTSYCEHCRVCEVECPMGAIKMENGKLEINGCIHCSHCLERPKGCIVAQSISIPSGDKNMDKRSIAVYETRGFRQDWLELLFEMEKNHANFWQNERLGPNMFKSFKKWLEHAELISQESLKDLVLKENSSLTELGNILVSIGSDSLFTWSVIYTNLSYNSSLINWYVNDIMPYQNCDNTALEILLGDKYTSTVKGSAIKSLKETMKASPIGWALGQAQCEMRGNNVLSITKHVWRSSDPLAILYALYKYAEHMQLYSFTLSDLVDMSRNDIANNPAKLFGIDRVELQRLLLGLSHDYADFIAVSFNKDLENINLAEEKTSLDIAKLYKEVM